MRKMYKRLAVLTVSGILLAACGTSNNVVSGHLISKRKVNKGFFINSNKKAKASEADEQEARKPFIQYTEEQAAQELAAYENVQQENAVVNDAAPFSAVVEDSQFSAEKNQAPAVSFVRKATKNEASSTFKEEKKNKEYKQEFRQAKKEFKKAAKAAETDKVLLVVLCFLLPPLAVYLSEGEWNGRCWLNVILTLLCGLPGLIHALIVVLKN